MIATLCIPLLAWLSVRQFRAAVGTHFTKENQRWLEITEALQTLLICICYVVVSAPLLMLLRRIFNPTLTLNQAISLLATVPLVMFFWAEGLDKGLSSEKLYDWIASAVAVVLCSAVTLSAVARLLWTQAQATILPWALLALASALIMLFVDFFAGTAASCIVRRVARCARRFGYGKKAATDAIADLVNLIDEMSVLPESSQYVRLNIRARLSEFRGEVNRAREKARLYDWAHAQYIAQENLRDLLRMRHLVHLDEVCDRRDDNGSCDCYPA